MNFNNNSNNNNNGGIYNPFGAQMNTNQPQYQNNNLGSVYSNQINVPQDMVQTPVPNSYQQFPYMDPGAVYTAVSFIARPHVKFSTKKIMSFTQYMLETDFLKASKDILMYIIRGGLEKYSDNPLVDNKEYIASFTDNATLTIKVKVQIKGVGSTVPALLNEVTTSSNVGLGESINENYFRMNPNILSVVNTKYNMNINPSAFSSDFTSGLSSYIDAISNYVNDNIYFENGFLVIPYELKIFMETAKLEYGPIAVRPTMTILNDQWTCAFGYELTPDVTMKLKADTKF